MIDNLTKTEVIISVVTLASASVATFYAGRWAMGQLYPTRKPEKVAKITAEEQLKKIISKGNHNLTEYETKIASQLVGPNEIDISWEDIAGLEDVVQDLKKSVLLPIQRKDLFKSSQLTRAPKGILLHGPLGCGKTLIAEAIAREAGTCLIKLDVSILRDGLYGESEKLARAVFSLAKKRQPCIIFIDEIDSFLRSRTSHDHEVTAMMKAQFMAMWDGLARDGDSSVVVLGATNRPQDVDEAIQRRMPLTFHIDLPQAPQRETVFKLILDKESTEGVDIHQLAQMTEGFSGSDIREVCRQASLYRLHDYLRTTSNTEENYVSDLRAITMEDLETSLSKMKSSRAQYSPPTIQI